MGRSGEHGEGPSNSEAAGRVARVREHLEGRSRRSDARWHPPTTATTGDHPDAVYRREVVDYRDPRIEAGLAVIRASHARIAERCRETGTRLVVVFIPTKENVFAGRIHHLKAHAPLPQLVADEEALKRTLIEDLDDLHVEYVDLLGPLRSAPAQPYFEHLDGHPSAAGHDAIAGEPDRILHEDLITARSR